VADGAALPCWAGKQAAVKAENRSAQNSGVERINPPVSSLQHSELTQPTCDLMNIQDA
jgi:hypothetical protein